MSRVTSRHTALPLNVAVNKPHTQPRAPSAAGLTITVSWVRDFDFSSALRSISKLYFTATARTHGSLLQVQVTQTQPSVLSN